MSRRERKSGPPQSDLHGPAVEPADRGRFWLGVLGTVFSLAVGVVIAERLTRPAEDLDRQWSEAAPATAPRRDREVHPPPPVRPSLDELTDDATRLADELAESFPDDAAALAMSGRILFYFGNAEKAKERWNQSVQVNPKSAAAWLGMAELARKQGDSQTAVDCMRRLAEADPALAREKIFLLVDSLLKLGRAREAADALEASAKEVPLPAWARVMLGQAYYQLADYARAAEQYQQALDDPRQASVAHYGLSSALVRLGRHDEARKHRREYARLQEKNMVVFDRMQQAGTSEERRDPVPWYPIVAGFHIEAGRLYALRGQPQRAEEHWLRAWALAPDRPEPRRLLELLDGQ